MLIQYLGCFFLKTTFFGGEGGYEAFVDIFWGLSLNWTSCMGPYYMHFFSKFVFERHNSFLKTTLTLV